MPGCGKGLFAVIACVQAAGDRTDVNP